MIHPYIRARHVKSVYLVGMAPKNNAKGGDKKASAKGKGKDASNDDGGKGKGGKGGGLKTANSINVRHILVWFILTPERKKDE